MRLRRAYKGKSKRKSKNLVCKYVCEEARNIRMSQKFTFIFPFI